MQDDELKCDVFYGEHAPVDAAARLGEADRLVQAAYESLVPHNLERSPVANVRIVCSVCGLKSALYYDEDGNMLDDCEWCYAKFDKAQIDAVKGRG